MTDIAGSATRVADIQAAYLAQARSKRVMNLILIVIFAALLIAGFRTADRRNAGGFWDGLSCC